MLRRLLIIAPVVVALTLVSLFIPARRVSIEGVGTLSFETTVTLSVGSEVAYAQPDTGKAESNFNVYSSPETVDNGDDTYTIKLSGENILIGQKNILIGQKASSTFKPMVTLNRWGNEASMDIGLPNIILSRATLSDGIISTEDDSYKVNIYGLTDLKAKSELGGLEFELVLKRKPPTNSFSFNLNLNNLVAYYQPPLTQEYSNGWSDECSCNITATETEVTDAETGEVLVHRPENVVGSYAVYHTTRGNAHRGKATAEKYKVGKAFHIYRPHLVDAVGEETWADLNIANGQLTITVDQAWLNSAVYPVIVDPTFGFTGIGGTTTEGTTDYIIGTYSSGSLAPAFNGKARSVSFYQHSGFYDNGPQKVGLYKGSDNTFMAESNAVSNQATNAWVTLNLTTNPSIVAGTVYIPVHWGEEYSLNYDAVTGLGRYQSQAYPGTWPSPTTWTSIDRKYSIYCTYVEPDISNDPTSYNFGSVVEGATPASGLTCFTVTNNSSFAANITISGSDMTGGGTWTLSDNGNPGTNIYGLRAGLAGDYTIIVKKNSPYNTLVSNLAASGGTQQWGLKLYAPTTFSDGVGKTGTVTLTATL
jgi:hypothetical protein